MKLVGDLKQMHSVVSFWNLVLWGIVEGVSVRRFRKRLKKTHAQLSHKQILKEMDFSVPAAIIGLLEKHKRCA